MSILISGVDMPKDGFITITVTSDGRVVGNSKKESGKFEYLDNEDIAKAVPVPTPHGRLIDADAIERNLLKMQQAQTGPCSHGVRKSRAVLRDAPTIIEADPAEEGE